MLEKTKNLGNSLIKMTIIAHGESYLSLRTLSLFLCAIYPVRSTGIWTSEKNTWRALRWWTWACAEGVNTCICKELHEGGHTGWEENLQWKINCVRWEGRSEKDKKGKCQSERQNVNFQFTQRKGRITSESKEE